MTQNLMRDDPEPRVENHWDERSSINRKCGAKVSGKWKYFQIFFHSMEEVLNKHTKLQLQNIAVELDHFHTSTKSLMRENIIKL